MWNTVLFSTVLVTVNQPVKDKNRTVAGNGLKIHPVFLAFDAISSKKC